MSVSGIFSSSFGNLSTGSLQDKFQQQVQQFKKDFQQLGQDLQTGNLTAAQSDFATLQQDAPQFKSTSSTPNSNPISQAFDQLSKDLTSGNLPAAQQDFSTIQQDFRNSSGSTRVHHHRHSSDTTVEAVDQLGQALQSGNLSAAQQAYSAVQQDLQQFALTNGLNSQGSSSQPAAANVSVQA